MLDPLLMAGRGAPSGIKGASRREPQMSHPGSATALRRRPGRLMRGASGSARPALQPAPLGLPTRLEGSNPRPQQRLVKTIAFSVPLLQAYLLYKHWKCDVMQV